MRDQRRRAESRPVRERASEGERCRDGDAGWREGRWLLPLTSESDPTDGNVEEFGYEVSVLVKDTYEI